MRDFPIENAAIIHYKNEGGDRRAMVGYTEFVKTDEADIFIIAQGEDDSKQVITLPLSAWVSLVNEADRMIKEANEGAER